MNKKIALLGALLIAGNSVASSQDNPWYAGARIGATHYSDFSDDKGGSLKDDEDIAAGVFLGHNFNDWFALETGYTYLGDIEVSDNTGSMSHETLELVGKFTMQATETFDLFIKLGGAAYKVVGDDELTGNEEIGLTGTAGLGIEAHFTDNFSARLEYQYYDGIELTDNDYSSEWNTHLFALGLVYSWGAPEVIVVQDAPVIEPTIVEAQTVQLYYGNAQSSLSEESTAQLQPIAQRLSDYPEATISVVGHTDSRGSAELNQKLSEERANEVSDYLTEEFAIDADRITASGAGEADPIATNETLEGQATNRRVSITSPALTIMED